MIRLNLEACGVLCNFSIINNEVRNNPISLEILQKLSATKKKEITETINTIKEIIRTALPKLKAEMSTSAWQRIIEAHDFTLEMRVLNLTKHQPKTLRDIMHFRVAAANILSFLDAKKIARMRVLNLFGKDRPSIGRLDLSTTAHKLVAGEVAKYQGIGDIIFPRSEDPRHNSAIANALAAIEKKKNDIFGITLQGRLVDETTLLRASKLSALRKVSIEDASELNDRAINSLCQLRLLETLHLEGATKISELGITSIVRLQDMKHLTLTRCKALTDSSISSLPFRNLVTLNLSGCTTLSEEGFSHLTIMAGLTSLNLNFCAINNRGLVNVLEACTKLRSLSMQSCHNLTEITSKLSSSKHPLEYLSLSYCTNLTGAAELLPQLQNLKSLYVEGCTALSDDFLWYARTLSSLQVLHLEVCNFTNKGLQYLSALTKLRELNLASCDFVNNQTLKALRTITTLEVLSLQECNIDDHGLPSLENLQQMRELDISGTGVGSEGLKFFKNMKLLESLNLCGCEKVRDIGLRHLSGLVKMKYLSLSGCNITQRGIPYLNQMKQLVTRETINKLV